MFGLRRSNSAVNANTHSNGEQQMPAHSARTDSSSPALRMIQPPPLMTVRSHTANHTHEMRDHAGERQVDLESLLITATMLGRADAVRTLLNIEGIDVNFVDENGRNPLTVATDFGYIEVVRALLSADGINPNSTNEDGESALMVAALAGDTAIVRALLNAEGINPNLTNEHGQTALMIAAYRGHTEIVQALLEIEDIDVNLVDADGFTALISASAQGHTMIAQALLQKEGIDVNFANEFGQSALILASDGRHIEIVRALLSAYGINLNFANIDGQNALMVAASAGEAEIVSALLGIEGIEVNIVDRWFGTALTYGSYAGNPEIVQALLDAGSDPRLGREYHEITNTTALEVLNNHPQRLANFRAQYLDSVPENLKPTRESAISTLSVNQLRELVDYSQRATNQLGMTDQAVYSQDMTKARFNELKPGAYAGAAAAHAGGDLPNVAMATIAAYRGGDPRDFILNKQSRQAADATYARLNPQS